MEWQGEAKEEDTFGLDERECLVVRRALSSNVDHKELRNKFQFL